MPVYEYKCKACDELFEVEQSIAEDSLTSLPGCEATDDGDHPLKKVFSAVGIAFKGEGFYRNDSRRSSSGSGSSSNSGSGSESDSSSSSDSGSSSSASSNGSSSSSESSSSGDKGSGGSSSSAKTSSSSTGSGASSD